MSALLPPDDDEAGSGTAYDPNRPFTWDLLVPGIAEPVDPGERWEYSNTGYILITEVLSRLLGGPDGIARAWRTMADGVAPALTDDLLTLDRSQVPLERMAHGHEPRSDGSLVYPYAAFDVAGVPTDLFGMPFGDGLFAGTAVGVALFLDGLFTREVVLEPATLDLMTETTAQAAAADLPVPDLTTYAMGTHRMQVGDLVWQGPPGSLRRVQHRRRHGPGARAVARGPDEPDRRGAPRAADLAGAGRRLRQSSGRSGLSTNSVKRR